MTIVPLARLFQRQGPRQDRHRARARQEAARQARGREDARLEPRQVAADAREGVRRRRRRGIGLRSSRTGAVIARTPSVSEGDEAIHGSAAAWIASSPSLTLGVLAMTSAPRSLQTFPSISTLFQGNSTLFQAFSKEIPRISKLFPWPFRAKPRGYCSIGLELRFLQFPCGLGRRTTRPATACRAR